MTYLFNIDHLENLNHLFHLNILAEVSFLYKLFIMGVCPLVFYYFVQSTNTAKVTSSVTSFKNIFIIFSKLLMGSTIKSIFFIRILCLKCFFFSRILLLKLACPVTIGQSVLSLVVIIGYVQILGLILNTGVVDCVVPLIEVSDLEFEERQINRIKVNIIPNLLRAVSQFSLVDFRYDISTHLRFREGYHAIGYIWPNASLSQIVWAQGSNPILHNALSMVTNLDQKVMASFGSAFYSHFSEQMSIVLREFVDLTPEEAREKHIAAMQELKNALPFYLAFQLPGVDFLLRALEYPTNVTSFYDVSLIGKVHGIYHQVATNMNDPYCPSLNEAKEEIFTNFENRIREKLLRPLSEDNQSSPPILSREELFNLSKCKKEFLQNDILKVKINKALVEQEHKYQLMAGGAMTVAIGYSIYKIAQIL